MQGYEAKLYWDDTPLSDGPGTGTWTELTIVKDVTLGDEREEVDQTTRAFSGRKSTRGGLRDNPVDLEVVYDESDTGFVALRTAYYAGSEIALAFMDGDIATEGNTGVVGNWHVIGFPRNEPLAGQITVPVTVKPSSHMEDYTVPAP